MNAHTSFGGLVKQRRVALGMSQAGLADLVGRSASAIRSWERGSSTPTDENVVRTLAAVLGIEESTLRSTVGMPSEASPEESDEVGGEGLAEFTREGGWDREDSLGGAKVASAGALLRGESEEEAPAGDEIGWDDVAASVQQVSEPVAEEGELADLANDEDEGGHPVEESPAESPAASESEDEPASGPVEPPDAVDVDTEPEEGRRDEGSVSAPPTDGVQIPSPEPVAAPAAAMTSRTAMIPRSEPPAQPIGRSYLNDPDQMMTYWIRAALTVAFTIFLLIVLFWALGRLGDSIGEVWDLFKAGT